MLQLEKNTEKVRQRAKELGFDACGFSKARRLEKHERLLEEWLHQDRQGQMQWIIIILINGSIPPNLFRDQNRWFRSSATITPKKPEKSMSGKAFLKLQNTPWEPIITLC